MKHHLLDRNIQVFHIFWILKRRKMNIGSQILTIDIYCILWLFVTHPHFCSVRLTTIMVGQTRLLASMYMELSFVCKALSFVYPTFSFVYAPPLNEAKKFSASSLEAYWPLFDTFGGFWAQGKHKSHQTMQKARLNIAISVTKYHFHYIYLKTFSIDVLQLNLLKIY